METTGLSPRVDRLVEIAVVRLTADGYAVDSWTTRIDPEGPVGATFIHGITDADVRGKPVFRDIAPTLAAALAGLPLVAHNAPFDLAFLRAEFDRAGWDLPRLTSYCTLDGSRRYFPALDRRRLVDCCFAAGVTVGDAHSALSDAMATAALFERYLVLAERDGESELRAMSAEAQAVSWPRGPVRRPSVSPRDARPANAARRFAPPKPSQPPLVTQLAQLSLTEVVDEGASEGTLDYLEMLLTTLEDGELDADEADGLAGLAAAYSLTSTDIRHAHDAFVLALAHRALDDGHVSREERAELHEIAHVLKVAPSVAITAIERADAARATRMSVGLHPLPADWDLGEPLRVGDRVVFTGCEEFDRSGLESRSEDLGVRVTGSVCGTTALLVTDDTVRGTKDARARELGTRRVDPRDYARMLAALQPALPRSTRERTVSARRSGRDPSHPAASVTPSLLPTDGPFAIRAWAIAHGYEVGARGRLPASVLDAYARRDEGR